MVEVTVIVVRAQSLRAADSNGKSDPYVGVELKSDSVTPKKVKAKKLQRKTKVVKKNLNPTWNETFYFSSNNPRADHVRFFVFDSDRFTADDMLGWAEVPVSRLETTPYIEEDLRLADPKTGSLNCGTLHVIIKTGDAQPPSQQPQSPPMPAQPQPPPMNYPPPPQQQIPPPQVSMQGPPPPVEVPREVPPPQPVQEAPPPVQEPPYRPSNPAIARSLGLTDPDVRNAALAFQRFDRDGGGSIDHSELKELIRQTVGSKMTNENILERFTASQFQNVDRDRSGHIDFDEFLTVYANLKKEGYVL